MARAGLVEVADASFEKDGKSIAFRKVRLTPPAVNPAPPRPYASRMKSGRPPFLAVASEAKRRSACRLPRPPADR